MDQRTEKNLTSILYFLLTIVIIFVLIQNWASPWIVVFLSGVLTASITLRNAVIYPESRFSAVGKILSFLDILIVFFLCMFDRGTSSTIFYYILIGDISLAFSNTYAAVYTFVCFLAYNIVKYISLGYPDMLRFITQAGLSSLSFIAVYTIMWIVKYEIKQRSKLNETMFELKINKRQLEHTYMKLKQTTEELEEFTIVKERNRIAREIHDTVGHTLTTVLLEMEAAERLIPLEPETALEKIRLAKGQVRRGLQDIRESVRTLQAGHEIMEFVPSLKLLIDETTKHGDIFIKYTISELPKLSEAQEKAIYRALQEGLTNGIKHGNSTAFVFMLNFENGNIKFSLQDNGRGTDNIVQGFGLTAMEERIRELGGIMNVSSKADEGFNISITIPVGREDI